MMAEVGGRFTQDSFLAVPLGPHFMLPNLIKELQKDGSKVAIVGDGPLKKMLWLPDILVFINSIKLLRVKIKEQ